MTNDGISRGETYLRDQVERSQELRTRRRREDRSRRRRLFLIVALGFILLLIMGAPSILCHSPAGRSLVVSAASGYGWDARVGGIRVGWITPLRLDGLELRGTAAATEISIEQIQTDLTITKLLSSSLADLGEITVRGLVVALTVAENHSSLEDDLAPLMSGPSSDTVYTANVHLQDLGLIATDSTTDMAWKLSQSNADLEWKPDGIATQFAGVLTEPGGSGGAFQGSAAWSSIPQENQAAWQARLQCESMPISAVSLARRRLGEAGSSIPEKVSGDSTGRLSVDGFVDGRILVAPEGLEIRNFTASDPYLGPKVWSNRIATVDGVVIIEATRLVGKQFQLTTDFATASMDGAVSTSLSIAGSSDNPVLWLDALDGAAGAEVDLALLDRALPGMLRLRSGSEIVSGKISARVDTLPSAGGARRSRLALTSEPIRARTAGQNILIEPIECVATVVNDRGKIAAEKFQWTSTFASAAGKGDLKNGNADLEIDFGRLATTLRPIVDLPENSLAGTARGNIRWNATPDNVWRLDGAGTADNVRLVLPSGQSFTRPTLRGDVSAIGHWDGKQLAELSKADMTVSSTGVNFQAALISPVRAPSSETLMPIQIRGSGRVEALTEMLGPWMPTELHECEGGFDLVASGDFSSADSRVTNVILKVIDPRAGYQDRYFTQPELELLFDGSYAWPSGHLVARTCTIKSNALTAAVQGSSNADGVNLEVAWNAKLDRLLGSMHHRIATRDDVSVQRAGFASGPAVASNEWSMSGDVTGNLVIESQEDWLDIVCQTTGKNMVLLQPASAATSTTVGPIPPNSNARATSRTTPNSNGALPIWTEPNLKIDGKVRYHQTSGEIHAKDLQLAGDWFATTLSGQVLSTPDLTSVELRGPGKLKMDKVGELLTSLTGSTTEATGLHETPIEITYRQSGTGDPIMNITASIGWESARMAGIDVGATSIPIKMTETTVFVSPAVVPLAEGKINLAGEVHYRPGPIWIRATPGRIAESIRLTREMNQRWLKYLAPLAADAAQVDGIIGATLDEAIIVLDSPEKNRVTGRLDINRVEMTAGPLTNQIIGGIDQLKAIARATTPPAPVDANKQLVTMPAQQVEFTMENGVVSHQRMFFQIDRAQIVTSGSVGLDSSLRMVAQVPLDDRWLGSDLKGLKGQSVNLPIDGTLSRPRLDSAGVRQVITQLGTAAAKGAAENFLQQNLNKGLDKIFGN